MSINLLLITDHDTVRQGIRALLQDEPGISVAGEAGNMHELLPLLRSPLPDVVVMDVNGNSLEVVRRLKKEYPAVKLLVLAGSNNESTLVDMLDAGADGYILKNSSKEELVFAIKKIANDGMYIGPEFTMGMLAKYKAMAGAAGSRPKVELQIPEREMAVLRLIAKGRTNTEIANELFTSVRTIETRRKNLLNKTGTTNTATLIRFAVLNGIIQ